jgi:hypothetical protein
MYANDPEMAKKWEKEEAIKGKLRNLIKQEIKSVNEMPNFDRGTSGLPRGFIDDYNKIVKKLSKGKGYGTLSRSDKKKVWATLGKIYNESVTETIELKKIDKLREGRILRAKQMVLLPDKKMYFDPMSNHLWLMGPYGGPDLDDDPIEPRDRDYNKIIRKLSGKDKSVLKKAMRTRKGRKEATTSVSVPDFLTPVAFKKSTQTAIDVDDEDDEKSESMAAPFRRRNSRGLGRVMKVGLNEGEAKPKKGDYVKTIFGIARIEKLRGSVAYMKLPNKKTMGIWLNDIKNLKPTDEKEKGKTLWTESINESDLGLTYKRGKTVKVTHKKSGKELVIIDKPNVKREYEKIGYFAEGQVNEISMKMQPFSSQEAKLHINADIKDMSKLLGKTSQKVIKIMMDGVKGGKYTAMDISRGIKEGPAQRTHFGEMTFIQSLWNKMREKFRRYSKDGKLS